MFPWFQRSADRHVRGPADGKSAGDADLLGAVRAVRNGISVEESFRSLDRSLRRRLESYFLSHHFRPFEVDGLVQSTLVKVYFGMKGLEREERFLGWLFTIARHVRLTAIERRARERKRTAGAFDGAASVADARGDPSRVEMERETMAERERRLEAVEAAIETLPPQQRSCLLLRVHEEMSYEEIAVTLALSVHTVRNHLSAARRSLRRRLGEGEVEL